MAEHRRAGLRSTPLRSQLVGLVLLLVTAALVLAGAAAVAALRGYLMDRVDEGLANLAGSMAQPSQPPADGLPLLDNQGPGGDGPGDPGPSAAGPVGTDVLYVSRGDATGSTQEPSVNSLAVGDPPDLPGVSVADAEALDGRAYEVDSVSGETRWRVITLPTTDGSGTVSAAQDITGINATVTRLILIELAIGGAVLLISGGVGWYLVRRSLRPLGAVEATAAAIAAGDLERRAPAADPRTEVGSLAASFNTMVDDLSGALEARQASERAARDAAQRARASEARMRQFVADAGHELRTPLTSVRGFAELYRIGAVAPGPSLDDAMARIEGESARMGVLVDDLLLLARLDQQRPLQRQPVDLVDLVADAVAAARAAAMERVILVHVSDRATGLTVPGDPHRLRQVIDNVLANALRYSPVDQPVRVAVELCHDPASETGADREWACVHVTDNGPGMPPEVASRVFERFYRADAARSRAAGGSGLGLAIVAAIVAAHGGRVDVRSAVGHGSTFSLLLPTQ